MTFQKTFIGGTAVASDIAEGKTATAGDVELTGTKAANSGVMLFVVNPTGITDTSYNPASEHGAVIVNNPGNGALSSGSTWDLDTDGFAQDTASFASFIDVASIPAYSVRRKYEIWGKTKDATLTNGYGVQILFNVNSGSIQDFWQADLYWVSASGFYTLQLQRFDAGVATNISSVSSTTALDVPLIFHIVVWEQGDGIVVQACMYENDVVTDDEVLSIGYTVATRPYKTQTRTRFRLRNTPGDEWLIRGCQISDMN